MAFEEANVLINSCSPFTTKKERKKERKQEGRKDKLKGKKYTQLIASTEKNRNNILIILRPQRPICRTLLSLSTVNTNQLYPNTVMFFLETQPWYYYTIWGSINRLLLFYRLNEALEAQYVIFLLNGLSFKEG